MSTRYNKTEFTKELVENNFYVYSLRRSCKKMFKILKVLRSNREFIVLVQKHYVIHLQKGDIHESRNYNITQQLLIHYISFRILSPYTYIFISGLIRPSFLSKYWLCVDTLSELTNIRWHVQEISR